MARLPGLLIIENDGRKSISIRPAFIPRTKCPFWGKRLLSGRHEPIHGGFASASMPPRPDRKRLPQRALGSRDECLLSFRNNSITALERQKASSSSYVATYGHHGHWPNLLVHSNHRLVALWHLLILRLVLLRLFLSLGLIGLCVHQSRLA